MWWWDSGVNECSPHSSFILTASSLFRGVVLCSVSLFLCDGRSLESDPIRFMWMIGKKLENPIRILVLILVWIGVSRYVAQDNIRLALPPRMENRGVGRFFERYQFPFHLPFSSLFFSPESGVSFKNDGNPIISCVFFFNMLAHSLDVVSLFLICSKNQVALQSPHALMHLMMICIYSIHMTRTIVLFLFFRISLRHTLWGCSYDEVLQRYIPVPYLRSVTLLPSSEWWLSTQRPTLVYRLIYVN